MSLDDAIEFFSKGLGPEEVQRSRYLASQEISETEAADQGISIEELRRQRELHYLEKAYRSRLDANP